MTNVSEHGFWLLVDGDELFLPFDKFPWFRDAPVRKIFNIERPQPHHLYWPALDIDLHIDSIVDPEKFPLMTSD